MSHNIWPREIELDCSWTICVDIINHTKELGNILDVLLVFVTVACDTQSCIKKHSNIDEDIIMHKLPKVGAVRTAWINALLRGRKQQFKKVYILS